MKIVLNKCYGGFSISPLAIKEFAKLKKRKCYFYLRQYGGSIGNNGKTAKDTYKLIKFNDIGKTSIAAHNIVACDLASVNGKVPTEAQIWGDLHHLTNRPKLRTDPDLIKVIEKLGKDADGELAELRIIEIPDGVDWKLDEYDGIESVAEIHRSWG